MFGFSSGAAPVRLVAASPKDANDDASAEKLEHAVTDEKMSAEQSTFSIIQDHVPSLNGQSGFEPPLALSL